MGLEPMISRTTIWRANQLHHTHHIYYLSNYLRPTKYHLIQFSVVPTSLGGFEPSTYGLEGRCSIQLSYRLIRLSSLELAPLNPYLTGFKKAGDGNRTHVSSLEG